VKIPHPAAADLSWSYGVLRNLVGETMKLSPQLRLSLPPCLILVFLNNTEYSVHHYITLPRLRRSGVRHCLIAPEDRKRLVAYTTLNAVM
jgi:hypothetical protein